MKILFILENTIKSLEGGTEVSSFHLARLLRRKEIEVEEWAPYSKRMPIYLYTALFFQIGIFLFLLWKCVKNRPQILHIQGKYLLPPAIIVGKILNIPTVATIRDYIVVCPIGLCLFEFNKKYEKHGFNSFFTTEVPKFLSIYHADDYLMIRIIKYALLIRGWFISRWLKFWLKQADAVASVSKYVQRVLESVGVESVVIHNSFDSEILEKISKKQLTINNQQSTILFVGKPSYGKGYDLFASLSHMDEFNRYEFKTIGGSSKSGYEDTLKEIGQALAVIVPSRWPEPFGRVALEALMIGTPVIASRRGGLTEIVSNGKTGILVEPTVEDMANSLRLIIKQNKKFRDEIKIQKDKFNEKFESVPLKSHINLYAGLLDTFDGAKHRTFIRNKTRRSVSTLSEIERVAKINS